MGFFTGERVSQNVYEPGTLTKWFMPKGVSGNEYNGLGDPVKARPLPVMHGPGKHPWLKMLMYFHGRGQLTNPQIGPIKVRHTWRDYFGHKPIAPTKTPGTAEEFDKKLRALAKDNPEIDVLGVARMSNDWMFQGQKDATHPWIIVVARAMNYDSLAENLKGNFSTALGQVIGGYERSQKAAFDLANWIRSEGYDAKAYGGLTIIKGEWHAMIPPAIAAGIGQLAKNGSMISDELGSCFRIATVLTDMPLVPNEPREIGVDEFCMSCKKCQTDCPSGAISNHKQMVRGTLKWYVDFDKCMPFMAEHKGCAICLSTCPWSRPEVAPSLSKKMLAKMARKDADQVAN